MNEFVTTSESRIVTAHGIFNSNEQWYRPTVFGPVMENKKTIDNWDARLLEYPFVYEGMTEEAYFEEKKILR